MKYALASKCPGWGLRCQKAAVGGRGTLKRGWGDLATINNWKNRLRNWRDQNGDATVQNKKQGFDEERGNGLA